MILFILLYYKVKPLQHTTYNEDKRDIVIKIVNFFLTLSSKYALTLGVSDNRNIIGELKLAANMN